MTRWWRCSHQTDRDHGCLIIQDISSTCVLEFVDYDGRLSWWSVEKCHHLIRSPGLTIAKHKPIEPCRAEGKCSKIGNNSFTIQFEFRNQEMKHPAQRMRTVRQPLKANLGSKLQHMQTEAQGYYRYGVSNVTQDRGGSRQRDGDRMRQRLRLEIRDS
ncbi:hypothetical protein FOMG_12563 [Fusarium oxysporum f. sp. melonis 26406]|uniref:Uncharacterized protein n=1 Tax=Fusarium oxysporum f. sp. melonis 26406 TaxID=1089452 RepID=X0AGP7_FUSOX|nr:hypothetical protein FOMG_12563 [Fusarium oxysporum f. sp. melonis 26406]EXK32362.1 hypothetical protein FOMG_12563 [Fusarium oxysporum f. sp. melonis 26406]EXK32363.1 hypothetical protein FOMG_12563 [Fusarium oxysporum f. sp. melonis 26406]